MRRLIALIITFTVCLAAPAAAGGPDNVVTASPTADGQGLYSRHIKVNAVSADTIDSANQATAKPHDCTGCQGFAVAFQAVIANGHPSTVAPSNLADAENTSCTSCVAFAFAYQYVVTTDQPSRLSDDGRAKVRAIRAQVDDAVRSATSLPDLDSRLKDLGEQFKAAVRDDLETHGKHPHDGRVKQDEQATGEQTT
jgi:hypothetical protein